MFGINEIKFDLSLPEKCGKGLAFLPYFNIIANKNVQKSIFDFYFVTKSY